MMKSDDDSSTGNPTDAVTDRTSGSLDTPGTNNNGTSTNMPSHPPKDVEVSVRPGLKSEHTSLKDVHKSNHGNAAKERPTMTGIVGNSLRSIQSALDGIRRGWGEPDGSVPTFYIEASDLAKLADARTRAALADVLEKHVDGVMKVETGMGIDSDKFASSGAAGTPDTAKSSHSNKEIDTGDVELSPLSTSAARDNTTGSGSGSTLTSPDGPTDDIESPPSHPPPSVLYRYLSNLVQKLRSSNASDAAAEAAATALTTLVLHSSPEKGIDPPTDAHLQARKTQFGENAIADKKLDSFLKLCWEAVQDFVLIMLICLGIITMVIETTIGVDKKAGETCGGCWIESAAILFAVLIVVLVTAGIDYKKQFTFVRLSQTLDQSNTKIVIRGGEQVSVVDADIVVGDILSVNSHNLATIPADCILLGPSAGSQLKVDESSLTGESKLVSKKPGDVILSGTTAVSGAGKMVVIAVGVNSVAGKIKARVYESQDSQDANDGLEGDEETPLFAKLTLLAKQIGLAGTAAATIAFLASCIIGLGINKEHASMLVDYFIVAVTVLAVAVPEGLPLAVTLALAFSSNRMTKEQNLVKHLDACETMGCATTICTDKTGTLTANKMSARAIYIGQHNFSCTDPSQTLGDLILNSSDSNRPSTKLLAMAADLIAVATMNESNLEMKDENQHGRPTVVIKSSGNPTECALLHLIHDLGFDYRDIRNNTRGRSDVGELAKYLSEGKQFEFSSARKMMSWAVPVDDGFRMYSKGASDVIIGRCERFMSSKSEGKGQGLVEVMSEESRAAVVNMAEAYARRGMRCLALAYRDLPEDVVWDAESSQVCNADGTAAFEAETDLVFVALVGIEDPLRAEVPDAIDRCYEAGIDVRMVTGDAPNTAVSIAYQAGILREEHFVTCSTDDKSKEMEMVASNLKENVLMEGSVFRERVYKTLDGDKKEFDQQEFDKIWPFLRVLARSSPDDKLTLAHGLNQSTLFTDKDTSRTLFQEHGIKIFPDRQVIAMTGDGTNDAPALKRADIGFAMGIAGTQIAKDAADIILLDDNFASIVTAAKWGRNVYASIQKFLQFQLTVNISAVTTALVGAFAYQRSPLAAIQLLWVNLLMDSLASLALASEPPKPELLMKPPVNRTQHLITKRMWANMLGQAIYQIIVVMVLLFKGPDMFGILPGHCVEVKGCPEPDSPKENSVHYTIIFNAFVWMQLFNEINSRNLKGEFCVFKGIERNPLFCGIWIITAVLQVIMVEFGSFALHVAEGGLDAKYWWICLGFGLGSFPIQQAINVVFKLCQKYKLGRARRRNHDVTLARRDISETHYKTS